MVTPDHGVPGTSDEWLPARHQTARHILDNAMARSGEADRTLRRAREALADAEEWVDRMVENVAWAEDEWRLCQQEMERRGLRPLGDG